MTTLTSYSQLEHLLTMFSEGVYDLLILEGKAGIGKSRFVQDFLTENSMYHYTIGGKITAIHLYEMLYMHQDALIILDDIPTNSSMTDFWNLLLQLCESTLVKTLGWKTKGKLSEGIPSSFDTTSRAVLLCNYWSTHSPYAAALQSRGYHAIFTPGIPEILEYASGFILEEILQFFTTYSPLLSTINVRQLHYAQQLLEKGFDWKLPTIESWNLPANSLSYILIDVEYPTLTRKEKCELWTTATHKPATVHQRISDQLEQAA